MSQKPRTPDQRTVTIGTKSAPAMWAEIFAREQGNTETDLRAAGFLPIAEIAEGLGMSRTGATTWCEVRKYEKREGRLNSGRRVIYYRPV